MEAAQKTMVSAYKDTNGSFVMVLINYANEAENVQIKLQNFKKVNTIKKFVTTAEANINMEASIVKNLYSTILLPARSISTIVIN